MAAELNSFDLEETGPFGCLENAHCGPGLRPPVSSYSEGAKHPTPVGALAPVPGSPSVLTVSRYDYRDAQVE